MRGILTFIGGLAVGILAVTGVFAMEESNPRSVEHDEDEMEEMETEVKEKTDDEGGQEASSS